MLIILLNIWCCILFHTADGTAVFSAHTMPVKTHVTPIQSNRSFPCLTALCRHKFYLNPQEALHQKAQLDEDATWGGKEEMEAMHPFNWKVRIKDGKKSRTDSQNRGCMSLRNSDKELRGSLWCCNYKGLHWPSVSGEASASGSSSMQNTNATISVTQQQEAGCALGEAREWSWIHRSDTDEL